MPARKTIAERSAAENARRRRTATYVIGAIPVAILLILAGVFVYQRATGLGPHELPSSIGASERADIETAIEDVYALVNQYNPQLALESMSWHERYDRADVDRFVFGISALLGEQLKFEVESLGTTTVDHEAESVAARVVTNYGVKDFEIRRLNSQWRVIAPPDLTVPQEAGPVQLEWRILNSYRPDNGATLHVAGTVTNVGDATGFFVGAGAYVDDGTGKTLATSNQALDGSPFIHSGEQTFFDITIPQPEGAELDPAGVALLPDFRPVGENDEASVAADTVAVSQAFVAWPAGAGTQITVRNGTSPRPVEVRVYAQMYDAAGSFLGSIGLLEETFAADEERGVTLPSSLPDDLANVTTLEIYFYGASRPLT